MRDGIGDDRWGFAVMFARTDESGGDDVLARQLPQFEVVARTERLGTEGNAVTAAGGFRGHEPDTVGKGDLGAGRDFQSLQFAQIHGQFS